MKKRLNNDYIIGGWTQDTNAVPPDSFSYAMYGMITNFDGLTTGTAGSPGWSPADTPAPSAPEGSSCKVMWTYGGAGGSPTGTPATTEQINDIVNATDDKNWAGVDFDNESEMNIDNIAKTTLRLKDAGKESSYTFLAGWNYNNTTEEDNNITTLANARNANVDRFVLMCYGNEMWSDSDIEANVGPAIYKTINDLGVPAEKVILALTHSGLNEANLNSFLDQVIENEIGGLFIWEYPSLDNNYLEIICDRLEIGKHAKLSKPLVH